MWKIIDSIFVIIIFLGTALCLMEILNLKNAYIAWLMAILILARLYEKTNNEHNEAILYTYSSARDKVLSKFQLIKFVYEANYEDCSTILSIQLTNNFHREELIINLKNNLSVPINMEHLEWLKEQTDLNSLDYYIKSNPRQTISEYQELLMFCETKIKYNI